MIGKFVRMNQQIKDRLTENNSAEHVAEFGNCIGVVEDQMVWPDGSVGPEYNVRWKPSNLRYLYGPDDLEVVDGSDGQS